MEKVLGDPRTAISPDQGQVLDGRKEPTHPLVVGRTKGAETTGELPTVALAANSAAFSIPTALEIATSAGRVDRVVLASVGSMDWGA